MKITDYGYMDIEMYHPYTKENIVDGWAINYESAALAGMWFLDDPLNPFINNVELESDWNDFLQEFNAQNIESDIPDFFAIEEFLLSIIESNLQTIRHSSSAIGHGMGGTVIWYVVDQEVVVKNLDIKN